ncbi:hypothetical protein [uncultured Sphingomonas sp.]|uniref:hypothetical protein n=1 Tax=uncultured Sphingomonas sp. TaxID=158754 RepID=UPI003749CBC3
MGATVAGRYLLLREAACSGLDKRGLADADVFDTPTLHALATCIAVVEQMCNVEQGSTIDFAGDVTPIRKAYVLNPAQHAMREPIQTAAIAYARTARDGRRDPDPPAVPAAEERDRAVPGVR